MNDSSSSIADRAEAAAERVSDSADGMRRSAERAFDSRRKGAADSLSSAASRLNRRADDLPGVQQASRAAHKTAERLEATAEYLRTHDSKAMAGNVMDLVRKHPGKSLAIAAAVGFLAARSMRSD
jgi:ElaB/YqjD/DUF883 family membrane-anchored ribosome-binding protein